MVNDCSRQEASHEVRAPDEHCRRRTPHAELLAAVCVRRSVGAVISLFPSPRCYLNCVVEALIKYPAFHYYYLGLHDFLFCFNFGQNQNKASFFLVLQWYSDLSKQKVLVLPNQNKIVQVRSLLLVAICALKAVSRSLRIKMSPEDELFV